MKLRAFVMAGLVGMSGTWANAQVTLLAQERSISLLTAADSAAQSRSAPNFGLFAANVSRQAVVPDPFGPINTGGDVAISCHFEQGIDLAATMSGWSLSTVNPTLTPVTSEITLNLEFRIESATLIQVMRDGAGSDAAIDESVEVSLRRLDSQRHPIFNDSDRSIGSFAGHQAMLPPGEYEFRFHALLESSGSVASRQVQLAVRFGDDGCTADMNQDGGVDGSDINTFFDLWETGAAAADTNADGGIDGSDIQMFMEHWELGC